VVHPQPNRVYFQPFSLAAPVSALTGWTALRQRNGAIDLEPHYDRISATLVQLDTCRIDGACAALIREFVSLRCGLLTFPQRQREGLASLAIYEEGAAYIPWETGDEAAYVSLHVFLPLIERLW
jgi:hypothetical protein